MTLLEHALHCHDAGLAVVPIKPDGQKRPAIPWAAYQDTQPTRDQVQHWFTTIDTDGLGIITGAGSGNLEMFEIEARGLSLLTDLAQLMNDNGYGDLWDRLNKGWIEASPSGGIHWHYRVDGPAARNTKLARRPATTEELTANPADKIKVLIETRGQGGFTVIAPSAGRTHPTGNPWTLIAGGPDTIPTISTAERDLLFIIASSLDTLPAPEPIPAAVALPGQTPEGLRPGDDYNNRATWDEILTPLGWTKTRRFGDGYGWTRPGKDVRDGISATTNTRDGADRLYVFSTSTEFDDLRPYSKFAAYCVTPETKILRADLTWAAAGDLVPGDGLVGVDEHIPAKNGRRKLRLSHVEQAERRVLPCYRITLADGRTITATDEHPWLAASAGKGGNLRWIQTQNLRPGQRIAAITDRTWERATDFDSGWLSGMFDGEGWAARTTVALAQKPGPVMDRAEALLRDRGFNVSRRTRTNGIDNLVISDLPSLLRLLGTLQPGRLVNKMPWVGRGAWTQAAPNAVIEAVEYVGRREVAAFMTTTRTFIAEGLISHNTLLQHGGDWRAAAKALRADGYGDQPTPISPEAPCTTPTSHATATTTTGNGSTPSSSPDGSPTSSSAASAADENSPSTSTRHLTVIDGTSALTINRDHLRATAERHGPTEDGTAQALAALHADKLRYCPQRGSWLTWTGARWEWDQRETHREYVRAIARALPEEDGWKTYKKRALSATGVSGITRLAQSDPAFVVHIDDLDNNPYELNTPGGIIDLRTGLTRPPDPLALHTRSTAVAPDYERSADHWQDFLTTTFDDDPVLIAYIQRLIGLSAIGTVLEQILPFAHGSGANGKSTLAETTMHTLGRGETGYAISAPSEMLMVRRHSEHPAELAQLAGARMVICSELEDGARFAEARVKQLTGRDSVNARFMRRDPFTFTPSHTMWLLGNHKPETTVGGPAFWRRVKLLPFDHIVPPEKRDPHLGEKLEAEAPAILAWIAQGAADYLASGLRTPDMVTVATEDYAHDQDTVARFVEEQCHRVGRSDVKRIRDAYEQWCREEGSEPVTARRLTQELRRFGVESAKSGSVRQYLGIGLVSHDNDDNDGDRGGW